MTSQVEELLQQVCNAALANAQDQAGDVALYCEADSGVVSAGLIYFSPPKQQWIFRFGGPELSCLLYSLWEIWPLHAGGQHWAALGIVISNGRLQAQPVYSDSFDASETKLARRARWFLQSVGAQRIDYSQAA